MIVKINNSFLEKRISHNNVCWKKLSEHSEKELIQLAIIALNSNNPNLKKLFSSLPSLNELIEDKIDAEQNSLQEKPLEEKKSLLEETEQM